MHRETTKGFFRQTLEGELLIISDVLLFGFTLSVMGRHAMLRTSLVTNRAAAREFIWFTI